MNSYAAITLIYAMFTLISSGVLYASFRKKIDTSAIYFLISELCMMTTCAVVFFINLEMLAPNFIWIGVYNLTSMVSEIAIIFSLLTLTKRIEKKWFFLTTVITAIFIIIIGVMRSHVRIEIVILMLIGFQTILFSIIYFICKRKLPSVLASNPFLKLFSWFMLGMIAYGVTRLIVNFFAPPVLPRGTPTNLSIALLAFYMVMGTFRYISYVGLRITWVDLQNPAQNLLNKPLARAIEEKDQLLRSLIASNRVIGISALASSLAHQLSQPLTTIALSADTTRRSLIQAGQDQGVIASLDEISTQSTKLAELVKNLRQLFGSRSYKFGPTNLQKIVNEIIEIVQPTLETKKIALIKDYQSDPVVHGDNIQIQQVLINVFNNAIDSLTQDKITPKAISIHITNGENSATISIKDSGPGIDQKLLPSIFELYKTTKQGGLGVGLWLSKVIMERHSGSINASNNPSGGAIFKIEIPLHRDSIK